MYKWAFNWVGQRIRFIFIDRIDLTICRKCLPICSHIDIYTSVHSSSAGSRLAGSIGIQPYIINSSAIIIFFFMIF